MLEFKRIYNNEQGIWKQRNTSLILDIDSKVFLNFILRIDGIIFTEFNDAFCDKVQEYA